MHLTVREEERIQIWAAAEMARRRLDRGVKLNYPEAIALIRHFVELGMDD